MWPSSRPSRHVVLLATLAGLAACASLGPAASEAPSVIAVRNGTGTPISAVFISGCPDPNWYTTLLEPGEYIRPGATRNFTQFSPGCWDLKVVLSNGGSFELREQRLRAGRTLTWTVQ